MPERTEIQEVRSPGVVAAWLAWYVARWQFVTADRIVAIHPDAVEGL